MEGACGWVARGLSSRWQRQGGLSLRTSRAYVLIARADLPSPRSPSPAGITRDSRHKRRATGGRRHPHQKVRTEPRMQPVTRRGVAERARAACRAARALPPSPLCATTLPRALLLFASSPLCRSASMRRAARQP